MACYLFEKFSDQYDIHNQLCKMDNKILLEFPWNYYNVDKSKMYFVYN